MLKGRSICVGVAELSKLEAECDWDLFTRCRKLALNALLLCWSMDSMWVAPVLFSSNGGSLTCGGTITCCGVAYWAL